MATWYLNPAIRQLLAGYDDGQRENQGHSGARGFCALAVLDGQYDEVFFSNCIDNPIAALTNPIEMVHALELRDAWGTRIGAERMEPFYEKCPKRFGECAELLLSRRGHKNCEDCLVQSEPQFFQHGIK